MHVQHMFLIETLYAESIVIYLHVPIMSSVEEKYLFALDELTYKFSKELLQI